MNRKSNYRPAVRYREVFKMQIVRELEGGQISLEEIRRKYGIGGCHAIRRWVGRYGNGRVGKVIRVETPQEINEREALKRRVRALERALADANIDLALERAYTELACERAGVDVEEFKKKRLGSCAPGIRSPRQAGQRCPGRLGVSALGDEPAELLCTAGSSAASQGRW